MVITSFYCSFSRWTKTLWCRWSSYPRWKFPEAVQHRVYELLAPRYKFILYVQSTRQFIINGVLFRCEWSFVTSAVNRAGTLRYSTRSGTTTLWRAAWPASRFPNAAVNGKSWCSLPPSSAAVAASSRPLRDSRSAIVRPTRCRRGRIPPKIWIISKMYFIPFFFFF